MKVAQKQANSDSNRSASEAAQGSWQNQSAQSVSNSKEAVAQRAIIAGINDSPRMLAQRRQIEGYRGTGQPQTAESAHPVSPITQTHPIQRLENPDDEEKDALQGKFASEPPAQLKESVPKANNTGLPDNLKSGIESLSGMSMDNVKVHYNSSYPAQLSALAYAQGTDIHIAPGQEQHLPHEAWHVVQQAQGRVKPTMQAKGAHINNDQGMEHEADVMGAQAMQFKEDARGGWKTVGKISENHSGAIQRIIKKNGQQYPSTYNKIKKSDLQTTADLVLDAVRLQIGGQVNEKKLIAAWNKLANTKTVKEYDVSTSSNDLEADLLASYQRSIRAQLAHTGRSGQTSSLVTELLSQNPELSFQSSARNPMVVDRHASHVQHDSQQTSSSQRLSTYVSTLGMGLWPGGQEFQSSFRHDGSGMHFSSNLNAINKLVGQRIQMAQHIKDIAAAYLIDHNILELERESVMADRVMRHVMKLYDRIHQYLASDANVWIPQNVPSELDGLHAEIRIVSEETWDEAESDVPTGTKYPCLGCFLYFNEQKIEIGHFHGPLWVTNAAMTKQLEAILLQKIKIGKMTAEQVNSTSEALASTYARLPDDSEFVIGKKRNRKVTYDYNADSDSDIDEYRYADAMKRLEARKNKRPQSPPWRGIDLGWEPESHEDLTDSNSTHKKQNKEIEQEHTLNVDGALHFFDPDEIASDGDCLFNTLLTLNIGNNIQALRQIAHQNGGQANILSPGVWGNINDITAIANHFRIRVRVIALDLQYHPIQDQTVGNNAGQTIKIVQIFGGHFTPLRDD